MSALHASSHDRQAIASAAIFSKLPPDALDTLLAQSQLQMRPRNALLFEQDERATVFYLLLEGWVKLFRMSPGGDETVVGLFTRGECIADVPCLTEADYPVSGKTVSDARLLAIPSRAIVDMTRANPAVCLGMLGSMSSHLKKLVDQIEELKACTGPQRLAGFLVGLAPVAQGSCTIVLPYEKLLIAGRLGMQPESLSRAFQRLRAVGVRSSQHSVAIGDVERLAEFAGRERLMAVRCPLLRIGGSG
jgi:CRP-like cAMP-binding protein